MGRYLTKHVSNYEIVLGHSVHLNVSGSVASKQLKILLEAGCVYFETQTSEQGKRPRTLVSLGDTGAFVFAAYVKKTQSLIAR